MHIYKNTFYRHKYGGIYQTNAEIATSTVDETKWVVYSHVWPFKYETYIRPLEEFMDGRFVELTPFQVREVFVGDRDECQQEIIKANEIVKDSEDK
jgi:hypothetical protein